MAQRLTHLVLLCLYFVSLLTCFMCCYGYLYIAGSIRAYLMFLLLLGYSDLFSALFDLQNKI